MASIAMPGWLRIVLVIVVVLLVAGAGLFGYGWYSRPATLSIAAGSLDGEATILVAALASRLAATKAWVRLNLGETTSALESADLFSSGNTDLAVVRGDVGDLSQAQAVVILAHAVVLLVAPPGSSIADVAGLSRLSVGVVGGEMNRKVVSILTDEYDLGRANVAFRNLAFADTRRALRRNAQRSTGPKSRGGKQRSRGNSFQNGLATALRATQAELEQRARQLVGPTADAVLLQHARQAAHAEYVLAHARALRVAWIERTC
jgi:hypothetical protein